MSTDQVNVTFKCKNCGGTVLNVEDEGDDASPVKCKECGTVFGTWGEVKAKAKETVMTDVRKQFKNAFKGLKGWKVK